MFKKLATEEMLDEMDKQVGVETPVMVHHNALTNLNRMNSMQRLDVRKRIFKNDDITSAKVRLSLKGINDVGSGVTEKLTRMQSVVRHYKDDKAAIEDDMKKRLKLITCKP